MLLRRWRTLQQCSWRDRWILTQALVLLPLTATALHLVSFARLQSLLSSSLPNPQARPEDRVAMTTRLVRIAANRGLVRVSCLSHSLVLWWLLRRQHTEVVLRVGVRKANGALEAHAWVEHRGIVLNDDADVHDRYAAFDRAIVQ